MNGELLSILEAIERDKGIDREILIQAVEGALSTAAKKTLGLAEEDEASVIIDRSSGRLRVSAQGRDVTSLDFSRIAAQTAKQVIIQKIREAERDVIFTEFQGRVGDIVTGSVHRFERGDIIVELGRAEAIVPRSERIPHEEYRQGDHLQGYVVEVRKAAKGPAIVLSRTHEGFIRGLFALEVPEIAEGIVVINGIAREPGDRTKIAVSSKDDKVDCVGACVGMRGTRVKNIVRELHGEKIDIVRWHDAVTDCIAAALSPAQIAEIQTTPETKTALVIVQDDQLSLAIGKKGQNVRLASKLTGWQLEIKSKTQLALLTLALKDLPGVGASTEQRLAAAGITTVQQLAAQTLEQLQAIEGIGEKTAQKLLEVARQAVEAATKPSLPTIEEASPVEPAPAESVEGQAPTEEPAVDIAPPEVSSPVEPAPAQNDEERPA